MAAGTDLRSSSARLLCGIVLGVQEDACWITGHGGTRSVRYATPFPSPRRDRVSPGHLVAVATAPDGTGAVVFRWYDAVVLGNEGGVVQLWEPAHGDVVAQPRRAQQLRQPEPGRTCPRACPVPTGGSPAPPPPGPRTPRSS